MHSRQSTDASLAPLGSSKAFRVGAFVLIVLTLVVLAGLALYIKTLASPAPHSASAAELNAQAHEEGYDLVNFTSGGPHSATREGIANLGDTTPENLINYFTYLHGLAQESTFHGGVRGTINGTDLFFDVALTPEYVSKVAHSERLAFTRVSFGDKATSVVAQDCLSFKGMADKYNDCAAKVSNSLFALLNQLPNHAAQHEDVIVQLNSGTNADPLHITPDPTRSYLPETVATWARDLSTLYYELASLDGVSEISVEHIAVYNPDPTIMLSFGEAKGECVIAQYNNQAARGLQLVRDVNTNDGLNLELHWRCLSYAPKTR